MNCPDCGVELKEVMVEICKLKTHTVDYENKKLTPVYPHTEWEYCHHVYRCPNCDTLNVDEMLSDFTLCQ